MTATSTSDIENVVIIAIDALRSDRVGAYGYHSITPNIDHLAVNGTLFSNAFSTTNTTDPAVTSMLTGKYLTSHGVLKHGSRISDEEYRSIENVEQIQQILSDQGYTTLKSGRYLGRWQQYGFDVTPDPPTDNNEMSLEGKLSTSLKRIDPRLQYTVREFYNSSPALNKGKLIVMKTVSMLNDQQSSDNPFSNLLPEEERFFTFIHLDDTHVEYTPQRELVEEYLARFDYQGRHIDEVLEKYDDDSWIGKRLPTWVDGSWSPRTTAVMDAKYDAAVSEADKKVGSIIRHLESTEQMDKTLIGVLSDHGESLGEHGIYYDHHGLYDSTIQIPLIMRAPFEQEQQRDELVQITDIAPTVLAALPVEERLDADGNSLLPLLTTGGGEWSSRQAVLFEEHHALDRRGIRSQEHKYIEPAGDLQSCRYCQKMHSSEFELYSLSDDPGEQHNVHESEPAVADEMKNKLGEKREQHTPPEMASTQPQHNEDVDLEKHLRDLGYI